MGAIFDNKLRGLRRARARRRRGDYFLHDRAFSESLERLGDIRTVFESALVVGPIGQFPVDNAKVLPAKVRFIELLPDVAEIAPQSFDLCITIGELESANDVAGTAFALRHAIKPGGLLLGTIAGGNSLPRLRAAMYAADRMVGTAAARFHPRIDGSSLTALLTSVGLVGVVVDIDRVDVAYASLDRLVEDLRDMGCTNILHDQSRRPLSRSQLAAARDAFLSGKRQAIERFELLHFAAWAPQV